jgi:hypothetical protein
MKRTAIPNPGCLLYANTFRNKAKKLAHLPWPENLAIASWSAAVLCRFGAQTAESTRTQLRPTLSLGFVRSHETLCLPGTGLYCSYYDGRKVVALPRIETPRFATLSGRLQTPPRRAWGACFRRIPVATHRAFQAVSLATSCRTERRSAVPVEVPSKTNAGRAESFR